MLEALMNLVSLCWKPFGVEIVASNKEGEDGKDGLLWYKDVGKCSTGEFSMSVIQGNQVLEDQSLIQCDRFGTFVGVYDGHGGPDAARFVCDHLFKHFQAILPETDGAVTLDTIERAFHATEEDFSAIVSDLWSTKPEIATVGTCCLVGVISHQNLFVANLGDSRAVLGRKRDSGGVEAVQLSTEHNANVESVRKELKDLYPDDPQIVMLKHGVWRVKGIIQVSRAIGDMYMKNAQYNGERLNAKFRLSEPINMPLMSAVPSIISHPLEPNDSFVIFASDGLWEHLSNETAVEIVHTNPHAGSARRLITAALHEAARKREMRYSDLQKIDKKVRRHFHDDITVIVLFLNHNLIHRGVVQDPPISIRCALEH